MRLTERSPATPSTADREALQDAERATDERLEHAERLAECRGLDPATRPWLGVPDGTRLSLIGTTTVFGTARDVTVDELVQESFFPADPDTAAALRRITGT